MKWHLNDALVLLGLILTVVSFFVPGIPWQAPVIFISLGLIVP